MSEAQANALRLRAGVKLDGSAIVEANQAVGDPDATQEYARSVAVLTRELRFLLFSFTHPSVVWMTWALPESEAGDGYATAAVANPFVVGLAMPMAPTTRTRVLGVLLAASLVYGGLAVLAAPNRPSLDGPGFMAAAWLGAGYSTGRVFTAHARRRGLRAHALALAEPMISTAIVGIATESAMPLLVTDAPYDARPLVGGYIVLLTIGLGHLSFNHLRFSQTGIWRSWSRITARSVAVTLVFVGVGTVTESYVASLLWLVPNVDSPAFYSFACTFGFTSILTSRELFGSLRDPDSRPPHPVIGD